jgi:hypothetical protein
MEDSVDAIYIFTACMSEKMRADANAAVVLATEV